MSTSDALETLRGREQAIAYVAGGARAYTSFTEAKRTFPADVLGVRLVCGKPDLLLLLEGTPKQLGDTYLQLIREPIGADFAFSDQPTLPAIPPVAVRLYALESASANDFAMAWERPPGNDLVCFVEIDVRTGQDGGTTPDDDLGVIERALAGIPSSARVVYQSRVAGRRRLITCITGTSPAVDEAVNWLQLKHRSVNATRTYRVMNAPLNLPSNVESRQRASRAEPSARDAWLFVKLGGAKTVEDAVGDLEALLGGPESGCQIWVTLSDNDIVLVIPAGTPDRGAKVYAVATTGLAATGGNHDSIRAFECTPIPLSPTVTDPAGSCHALITIHVRSPRAANADALATALAREENPFSYLGAFPEGGRLHGRGVFTDLPALKKFILDELRGRHHAHVSSTVTYQVLDHLQPPHGSVPLRTPQPEQAPTAGDKQGEKVKGWAIVRNRIRELGDKATFEAIERESRNVKDHENVGRALRLLRQDPCGIAGVRRQGAVYCLDEERLKMGIEREDS